MKNEIENFYFQNKNVGFTSFFLLIICIKEKSIGNQYRQAKLQKKKMVAKKLIRECTALVHPIKTILRAQRCSHQSV
jgi:hypothetical protein